MVVLGQSAMSGGGRECYVARLPVRGPVFLLWEPFRTPSFYFPGSRTLQIFVFRQDCDNAGSVGRDHCFVRLAANQVTAARICYQIDQLQSSYIRHLWLELQVFTTQSVLEQRGRHVIGAVLK